MVNFNGVLHQNATLVSLENRAYKYGDALFETIKVVNGMPLFWEDHYFRLMASMRILRMEIPMQFTMEFLEHEILKTLEANGLNKKPARVRLSVDRGEGGTYLPISKEVNFSITTTLLDEPLYAIDTEETCEVDLFKDFFINEGLLSSLKTTQKITNVLGSIYAQENDLDNCLLLNNSKSVVECLNGNLFMVHGNVIKTPPIADGCLNGILRKQLMTIIAKQTDFILEDVSISTFELQKADELFYTNVIKGIVPITNYRKKTYQQQVAKDLLEKLNANIKLIINYN